MTWKNVFDGNIYMFSQKGLWRAHEFCYCTNYVSGPVIPLCGSWSCGSARYHSGFKIQKWHPPACWMLEKRACSDLDKGFGAGFAIQDSQRGLSRHCLGWGISLRARALDQPAGAHFTSCTSTAGCFKVLSVHKLPQGQARNWNPQATFIVKSFTSQTENGPLVLNLCCISLIVPQMWDTHLK